MKNTSTLTPELLRRAKAAGFSDCQLATIWNVSERDVSRLRKQWGIVPVFKTVDTCAAEFQAKTPYYYSSYDGENESLRSDKKKVVILGGGPNRIGQGIEFDYCCVHGMFALREAGYEAIMINCNPETVSTDYDIADKLYFEPLTLEDVTRIIDLEQPYGVIVSFGGQTPLKLARPLHEAGVRILGTPYEGIDLAEDRERFGNLLRGLNIPQPPAGIAHSESQAVRIASEIGYPVLVRPSYVLGGGGMHIVYSELSLRKHLVQAFIMSEDHPVLIDKFLEDAIEFDVDALCDGTDVFIGGIMQHIEEAGIHSGDSMCTLPPTLSDKDLVKRIEDKTRALALGIGVLGLVNIQFAVKNNTIYVLEANPRASRTVPFVSKTTGVPLAKAATRIMLGQSLKELELVSPPHGKYLAVKKPVFPFVKLKESSYFLGPEMHSTGEVMGIAEDFGEAMAKAHVAADRTLPTSGTVFISLNNRDKRPRALELAQGFLDAGFHIMATRGTSIFLTEHGIPNTYVLKVHEGRPDIVDAIKNGEVNLVINTPIGAQSKYDEHAIGANAFAYGIPVITNVSAAFALLRGIRQAKQRVHSVKSLQEFHAGHAH